jgi:hypothetical protein
MRSCTFFLLKALNATRVDRLNGAERDPSEPVNEPSLVRIKAAETGGEVHLSTRTLSGA